jgi:hypothetical protein
MRTLLKPSFTTTVVDPAPRDGYWVQAVDIDGDGRMDLVASGLTRGEVVWYHNPDWTRRVISTMDKPVALDVADLTGDGRPDLVICHDYGNCMFDCGPSDGRISWLRNPTRTDADGLWEHRPIAELVATHRVRLGRFSSAERLQVAALPVVGAGTGADSLTAPVRAMVFDQPTDPLSEDGWTGTELDTNHFRVVHGVVVDRFPDTPDPEHDAFLLASAEGVSWLGTDEDGHWQSRTIGTGVAPQPSREFPAYRFQGSGNLAVGRVDGVPHALIVAVEPFHGNTVAVYIRPPGLLTFDRPWERREVEVFPAPDGDHDAVAHHVAAADFDGDGDDEFLVAVRGPAPTQGVYYYKFDASGRLLLREQVSTGSVARIAVADFHGAGRLDFVTTAYDTVGYYEIDDPRIELHTNTFAPPAPVSAPPGGDG